jgi:hypothetical protein
MTLRDLFIVAFQHQSMERRNFVSHSYYKKQSLPVENIVYISSVVSLIIWVRSSWRQVLQIHQLPLFCVQHRIAVEKCTKMLHKSVNHLTESSCPYIYTEIKMYSLLVSVMYLWWVGMSVSGALTVEMCWGKWSSNEVWQMMGRRIVVPSYHVASSWLML